MTGLRSTLEVTATNLCCTSEWQVCHAVFWVNGRQLYCDLRHPEVLHIGISVIHTLVHKWVSAAMQGPASPTGSNQCSVSLPLSHQPF